MQVLPDLGRDAIAGEINPVKIHANAPTEPEKRTEKTTEENEIEDNEMVPVSGSYMTWEDYVTEAYSTDEGLQEGVEEEIELP